MRNRGYDHGYHDGPDGHGYGYGRNHTADVEPRREYRSRTPGPDFMRGTNVQDEYMRQRPPEIRSKTPTHELHYGSGGGGGGGSHHHNISGTPDFIPASRYLPPASSPAANHHGGGYGGYQQGSPGRPTPQDAPYTRPNYDSPNSSGRGLPQYGGGKLNSSQTFAGSLNYASGSGGSNSQQNRSFDSYGSGYSGYHQQGAGDRLPHSTSSHGGGPTSYPDLDPARPRKQSTSFEHEEPAPTNLTRIPRGTGGGPGGVDRFATDSPSSSLNRSRSPTRFGSDDDRYMELTVFLKRQESGFGFRIIGGTEEGSQVRFQFMVSVVHFRENEQC